MDRYSVMGAAWVVTFCRILPAALLRQGFPVLHRDGG